MLVQTFIQHFSVTSVLFNEGDPCLHPKLYSRLCFLWLLFVAVERSVRDRGKRF